MNRNLDEDFFVFADCMKMVANNLYDLYLMIDTIVLGLMQEKAEPQAIACLTTIRQCVKSDFCIMQHALQEYKEKRVLNY